MESNFSFLFSKNALSRVVMGILLALISILCLWLGGIFLFFLVEIFVVLALFELYSIFRERGYISSPYGFFLVSSIFIPCDYFLPFPKGEILAFFLLLVFLISLFRKDIRKGLTEASYSIFALVYIPFLGSFIFSIRDFGVLYLFYLFLSVWVYDILAYYTGALIGKNKIWETLSPKKTYEGIIGGCIGTIAVSILLFPFLNLPLKFLPVFPVVLSFFAQMGDFFESMLKREMGVKDASGFLLGHGGILDRIDSLLFALPAFYILLILIRIL